jgi:hypothetical protein
LIVQILALQPERTVIAPSAHGALSLAVNIPGFPHELPLFVPLSPPTVALPVSVILDLGNGAVRVMADFAGVARAARKKNPNDE